MTSTRFSGAHSLYISRFLGSAQRHFSWLSCCLQENGSHSWLGITARCYNPRKHAPSCAAVCAVSLINSPINWIDQIEIADFGHYNHIITITYSNSINQLDGSSGLSLRLRETNLGDELVQFDEFLWSTVTVGSLQLLAVWRCSELWSIVQNRLVRTWCNIHQHTQIQSNRHRYIEQFIEHKRQNISDLTSQTLKIWSQGLWTSSSPRTWTRTLGCWRMWRRSGPY